MPQDPTSLELKFLVEEITSHQEEYEFGPSGPRVRAPSGGIDIGGQPFKAGQFLPVTGSNLPTAQLEQILKSVGESAKEFGRSIGETHKAMVSSILKAGGSTQQAVAAQMAFRKLDEFQNLEQESQAFDERWMEAMRMPQRAKSRREKEAEFDDRWMDAMRSANTERIDKNIRWFNRQHERERRKREESYRQEPNLDPRWSKAMQDAVDFEKNAPIDQGMGWRIAHRVGKAFGFGHFPDIQRLGAEAHWEASGGRFGKKPPWGVRETGLGGQITGLATMGALGQGAGLFAGARTGGTLGGIVGGLTRLGPIGGPIAGIALEKTLGLVLKLNDALEKNVMHFRELNVNLAPFSGLLTGQQQVQALHRDVLQLGRAQELAPALFRREQFAFARETAGFNLQTEIERLRLDVLGPLSDITNVVKIIAYQFLERIVRAISDGIEVIKNSPEKVAGLLTGIIAPMIPGGFGIVLPDTLRKFNAAMDVLLSVNDEHRFSQVLGDLDYLLYGGPNPTVPRGKKDEGLNFDPFDPTTPIPDQVDIGSMLFEDLIRAFIGMFAGQGGFPQGAAGAGAAGAALGGVAGLMGGP